MGVNLSGIGMTSWRSRERLAEQLREMGIVSEPVLSAIIEIPRHIFVDEALASRAYENTALPIGHNQTISQPYIVAKMAETLLASEAAECILEIGTGCGYQTAVLARCVKHVHSIERISALLQKARQNLLSLKCYNVSLKCGDGTLGWAQHAPFDGIIVAAAPRYVPEALTAQLAVGGRLVIPVGSIGKQQLKQVTRTADGFEESALDLVSFVPMLSGVEH